MTTKKLKAPVNADERTRVSDSDKPGLGALEPVHGRVIGPWEGLRDGPVHPLAGGRTNMSAGGYQKSVLIPVTAGWPPVTPLAGRGCGHRLENPLAGLWSSIAGTPLCVTQFRLICWNRGPRPRSPGSSGIASCAKIMRAEFMKTIRAYLNDTSGFCWGRNNNPMKPGIKLRRIWII